MRLAWAVVDAVVSERDGLQRLQVSAAGSRLAQAINYTTLAGVCAAGDAVLLNTTAVDLDLGTGGAHFVVARTPAQGAPEGLALDDPSGGHIMKLRYTPLQRDVLCAEAPESPHHDVLAEALDVGGMPVVCCGLLSQVPLVAAAVREARPWARVAYCMTDQAALPLALSDLVASCREAGLLDTTVTCGQAFGGEIEAVTLHSGLLAARHVARADVAIVGIGPGIVGSASPFGHGGVAQGEAINAAASVGARPVAVMRVSSTDERERHRGVSHHTLTALGRVALAPAAVAVPHLEGAFAALVERQAEEAGLWARHTRADVAEEPLPGLRGVEVRSMGRSPADDPEFFAAAAAGGRVAAEMLPER
jgi:hypothetical protein